MTKVQNYTLTVEQRTRLLNVQITKRKCPTVTINKERLFYHTSGVFIKKMLLAN